jgi:hypothetical protein
MDIDDKRYAVERTVLQLLVTANVVLRSSILVTMMMEEIYSSEISVLTRAFLIVTAEKTSNLTWH